MDAGLLPVAGAALVAASVFGRWWPHVYDGSSAWLGLHRASTLLGAAAGALAAAAGGAYLVLSRRLHAHAAPTPQLGSLALLERATFAAASAGFVLMSVGLVTGWPRLGALLGHELGGLKLALVLMAWAAYALVLLGVGGMPWLRGRLAATLSVTAFGLLVASIVVVQFT